MNKIAVTLLAGSLALGGYGLVNASPDSYEKYEYQGKHCKHGKEGRLERMKSTLDLSEDQVTKIRAIKDKYRPEKMALRGKMKDARKQLREAMHADSIDKNKVKKLARQMGDLKTQKILLRADMKAEVHSVLTSEQRAKKKDMFKGRHEGYREHHGKHHDRHH